MLKNMIIIGILLLIIFVLSGCDVFTAAVQNAIEQTQTASANNENLGNSTTKISQPASTI